MFITVFLCNPKERRCVMSTSYKNFSYVYDTFMDNIPYKDWAKYLTTLYAKHSITTGALVELGCGTGTMCKLLSQKGFSVHGIDLSSDMLTIAKEKTKNIKNITFSCQNMCDFELDQQYDGFYSVCDSINYLLYEEELLSTFSNVKNYLKTKGIFIFDLKTPYFYENILGDQTFCDHRENCSYIWENSYFEEDGINQYDLTIFARNNDQELFERFTETHHQKAYSLEIIVDLLKTAGLEYVIAYDAFTTNAPHTSSERIYIIARNGE